MTEYELECARAAFMRAMEVGAPGIALVTREAIASSAAVKLRHQFNIPHDRRLELPNDHSFRHNVVGD